MPEMWLSKIVLLVLFVGTAWLMWWMADAAADGRLRRNQIAGVRIPSTLASEEAWQIGHRAARRPLKRAAIVAGAAGVLQLALPTAFMMGVVLGGAVILLVLVIRAAVLAGRAASAYNENPAGTSNAE